MISRLQEDKNRNAGAVLAWLGKNLVTAEFRPIDRPSASKECSVPEGTVTRATIVLREREYIILEHPRTTLLKQYKLSDQKSLGEVTPEQLANWITGYNQASSNRIQQEQTGSNQATPLFEPVKVEVILQPEPLAGQDEQLTPLSPIQQLLQQAQQLAEAESRRESEQSKPAEELASIGGRLDSVEGKLSTVLNFFFQAATALKGYEPISEPAVAVVVNSEPVAPPTTRALLVRLVNSYSAADRKSEHDTWKYLYGQFDLRTGFNAYAQTPNRVRDVSYLSVIEERGQIDALYELAKKLLVLPELK